MVNNISFPVPLVASLVQINKKKLSLCDLRLRSLTEMGHRDSFRKGFWYSVQFKSEGDFKEVMMVLQGHE